MTTQEDVIAMGIWCNTLIDQQCYPFYKGMLVWSDR